MAELRPAGQRQADLEMRRLSKYEVAIGLTLAAGALVTGELANSSEHSVLMAQRLVPDLAHSVPLLLKGKVFYVTEMEMSEYRLYQYLFLGVVVLGCVGGLAKVVLGSKLRKEASVRDGWK